MSDEKRGEVTNELIFELLKTIQRDIHRLRDDMVEVKQRLGFLEQQYASISVRADRMDERLTRIEKRLELVEA